MHHVRLLAMALLCAGCTPTLPENYSSESQPQIAAGPDGDFVATDTAGVYHWNWDPDFEGWQNTRGQVTPDFSYGGNGYICQSDNFIQYDTLRYQFELASVATGYRPDTLIAPSHGPQRPVECILTSLSGDTWTASWFTEDHNTDGMRITRTVNKIVMSPGSLYDDVYFITPGTLTGGQIFPAKYPLYLDNKRVARTMDIFGHVFIAGNDGGYAVIARMDEAGNVEQADLGGFPYVSQTVTMSNLAFPPVVVGTNDLHFMGVQMGDLWADGTDQKLFFAVHGPCHRLSQHVCTFIMQIQNDAGTHYTTLDDPTIWNPVTTWLWSTDIPRGEPTVDTWQPMVTASTFKGGIPVFVGLQSTASTYPAEVIGAGLPGQEQLTTRVMQTGTGDCQVAPGKYRCMDYGGATVDPVEPTIAYVAGSVPVAHAPFSHGTVWVSNVNAGTCTPPLLGCPIP
jgi:hypothetical protein